MVYITIFPSDTAVEIPTLSSESSFLSIIQEIQSEATRLRLHQYLSRHNQRRFLTDLTIVALSVRYAICEVVELGFLIETFLVIRTGYLVDLFVPNDPVRWFSSLLAALRIVSTADVRILSVLTTSLRTRRLKRFLPEFSTSMSLILDNHFLSIPSSCQNASLRRSIHCLSISSLRLQW
jgi:hypothetical protein